MRAIQDSKDAAFRALSAADACPPLNFRQDMIAVHGVFDGVARDEHVAVELWYRNIRHNETVAVMVENKPPFYFIAIREWSLRRPLNRLMASFAAGRLALLLAAWKPVPTAGEFLDGAAFL
jgi:hypothetical protein